MALNKLCTVSKPDNNRIMTEICKCKSILLDLGMGLLVIGRYAVSSTGDRYGSHYEYISRYASR